jgi:hypothetical protein
MEAVMYCQKCGADNLENATICQSCGGVFVYSQPIKTSGMAITSMILSISCFPLLGVFGIVWILGLVFGLIALNRINKSGGTLKGKGFAITGIAVSSAGLAVLLTLVGVLLIFNSVSTISVHKKLRMQADNQQPEIAGIVQVVYTDGEPNNACVLPLFTKEQIESKAAIAGQIECPSPSGRPIVVKWEFLGEDRGEELYNFNVVIADANQTLVSEKKIEYDGEKTVVYKNDAVKVIVAPAE